MNWLRRLLLGKPCEKHIWLTRYVSFRPRPDGGTQLEAHRTCQICFNTLREWLA